MKRIAIALAITAAFAACSKKEAPAAPQVAVDQQAAQQQKFDLPPDHPVIGDQSGPMGSATSTMPGQEMPAGHAGSMGEAKPAEGMPKISGKVLEAKDAGDFTYIRLSTSKGEQWVAAQRAAVKVGSTISIIPRMTAQDFESKAMGKKFDTLVFGLVEGAPVPTSGMAGAMAGMPPQGMGGGGAPPNMGAMHSAAAKTVDAGPINVPKAEGGKTVAEIYAQRASLANQNVAVRGKVVKFLPNIMGKNWIHLQDGTGSKEKGDNDLTITTSETAKAGDVVLISGVVKTDQKMGMGMSYPVIVEGARVSK